MRYGKLLTALAVVIGMATLAQAATVQTALRLQDTGGNDITPTSPGVWTVTPGETFEVVLSAEVLSPNTTDTFRSAANNGVPLGLQGLTADILSNNSVGQLNPSGDPVGPPPTWHNYADLTVSGAGVPFVNLVDEDSDGDLDPAHAGMNYLVTTLASGASASLRANVQIGANGGFDDINSGEYVAGSVPGSYTLLAQILAAGIYSDPANTAGDTATQKAALLVTDVAGNSTSGQITIVIAPEPTSIGLAGLGCLSLLGVRRRRV